MQALTRFYAEVSNFRITKKFQLVIDDFKRRARAESTNVFWTRHGQTLQPTRCL